ncbi:LysR substrate-binding domain-containing protein [Marinomonas posidonica]|uniref:Transcriptional regulator, LysR family n=1 Tax=Marinomonas posidonica (strain CECT 7376 / NCIMB 14433 / IVIA-Po-181) TaxID=491952 RepID=F6CYX7_MARPP|nr:LysR substrate-binding domain-containing protein [Marinomonas posidonica]AEF53104.1 transcriptional regulator, LysR family [Marinomonas posidonica IVIA-Po-181]
MSHRVTHLKATHYFSIASQTMSYTKAAEQLNVSQAAVSQQIRLLEDYLGVSLFYRAGREMRLTSQGLQLAEHLTLAFDHISKGLDSVKLEPLEGTLQVSGLQSFVSLWLMPKLWRFSDLQNDITVKLFSSDERRDIHAGNIDIGIDDNRHMAGKREDTVQRKLISSDIIPVCSPSLAARIDLFHPTDLLKCWMLQVDDPSYQWRIWFEEQAICPIRSKDILWAEVNSWYMGINAVKAGHGIFLCPKFMVQTELDEGTLIQAYPKALKNKIEFYTYYAKNSPRKARIEAFVDWLNQEVTANIKPSKDPIMHNPLPWP